MHVTTAVLQVVVFLVIGGIHHTNTHIEIDGQHVVARVDQRIPGDRAARVFCDTVDGLAAWGDGVQCDVLAAALEAARQNTHEPAPTVRIDEKARLAPLVLQLDHGAGGIRVGDGACTAAGLEPGGGADAMIEAKWRRAWSTPSDIHEHVLRLTELAMECDHITDVGVRSAVATSAFLRALTRTNHTAAAAAEGGAPALRVRTLRMHDLKLALAPLDVLCLSRAAGLEAHFVVGDILRAQAEHTDLLFIDSLHCYGQLKRELARLAPLTRKYIALHDTTVDADVGECVRLSADTSNETYTQLVHSARAAAELGGPNDGVLAAARMAAATAQALGGRTPALCAELAAQISIPMPELQLGLWPAVVDFLSWNPHWELLERRANNNGLTILRRKALPGLSAETDETANSSTSMTMTVSVGASASASASTARGV